MECRIYVFFARGISRFQESPSRQVSGITEYAGIIYIYIHIYIYTRFAYGALRRLWSRTKHRSKQCSASEGEMSKSELSTVDSNAWVEAAQCLRRKDKHTRAVISSAQWLLSKLEQRFRARSGY